MESLKILFIGSGASGKTSLVYKILNDRWSDNIYEDNYFLEDTFSKMVICDEKKYLLDIFKLQYQEDYKFYYDQHLKNAEFPVFIFSVDNKSSLKTVEELIERFMRIKDINDPYFIVLGLKIDLDRKVSSEDIEKVLKLSKNSKYMEFSTKNDKKHNELVLEMIQFFIDFQKNEKIRLENLKNQQSLKKGLFSSIFNQKDAQDDVDHFKALN